MARMPDTSYKQFMVPFGQEAAMLKLSSKIRAKAERLIEFVMVGIVVLPGLFMLGGDMLAAGWSLFFLLITLAAIGNFLPPPEPPDHRESP